MKTYIIQRRLSTIHQLISKLKHVRVLASGGQYTGVSYAVSLNDDTNSAHSDSL